MREQYDTTGLHPVKLEFPEVGSQQREGGGWSQSYTYDLDEPEEMAPEERSELADRRWWRSISPDPAHPLSAPTSYAAGHVRRAVKAGVDAERVDLLTVADRDRWRCGLCGKRVVKTARGRRSASLDHIVPIARGGGNLYSNVQLAHLECNWAKRDRDTLASQMRLF